MLGDRRVACSQTSAFLAGSDPRVGPGPAAVWVRTSDDLTERRGADGLVPAAAGNLTVSIAGTPQVPWLGGREGDAYRLGVAADLLSEGDARGLRAGRVLLVAALAERRWRSSRPVSR